MHIEKKKVQSIKNMILRGMVKHSEIKPRLARAEFVNINPDDIAQMSIDYKGRSNKISSRFVNKIIFFINLIFALLISLAAGVTTAEITAGKIFSNSILEKKLTTFGDNLLYWIGLKSIALSGTEMLNAMSLVIKATPELIKSFFYGFITGLFAYLVFIYLIKFIYKRKKINFEIIKLLNKNVQTQSNIYKE